MRIPIREAVVVTLLILLPFVCFAQTPQYSADGDTAYICENAILKDKNSSHVSGPLPPYSNTITSTTWGSDMRLTHLASMGGNVGKPTPIISSDFVGVFVSVGFISPGFSTYKSLSYDFGENWTAPESVEVESTYVDRVGSPDTVIYMTGSTHGPLKNSYFIRSFDDGITWQDYHEFEVMDIGYIGKGTLNALGDSVYRTYYVPARQNIDVDSLMFTYSQDRGESWTDVTGIIYLAGDLYSHWIRISQNRMHLVFQDFNQGLIDIFYSISDDFGLSWSDPIFISGDDNYSSQWPYLSADESGNLCASWFDYKYGSGPSGFTGDLLYRVSRDNGETWGPEQRLTYDHLCTASRSIIDGDYISFIWLDHYEGWLEGNLSFKESFDSGNSWSDKVELTNNGPGHNVMGHELIYDSNSVYLFWQDDRDSYQFNHEIYFKKGEVSTTRISENPATPVQFEIMSVYPNPFNGSTTIDIHCKPGIQMELSVYDILGSKVKTLFEGQSSFERSQYIWDGMNQNNEQVRSGVYFFGLRSKSHIDVKKAVFLK